ncbi:phosphatase PAP2 family protein [Geobacter pickeringii]|uniref:phosphatase PAP2 family protein n=1 Tax=Geobacter pickeringii TaxID=345632 RepID=UPI00068A7DC1|nr:phosphatase PAP2 family protein [Geobacter pickeringii]
MNPHLYHTLYGPESLNFKLFMAINHAHHPLLDPVMEAMISLGGSKIVYLYAAILLCVGLARRQWLPLRYVGLFCLATVLGLGLEELLKGIAQVPRPGLAIGLDRIMVLGEVKLRNSFPSGHAIFAFVTAFTLSWRRGAGWKVPLYAFAVLVAYSRVYVGAHYPLDVTAGAVVGICSGWVVWKGYEAFAGRRGRQREG